MPSPTGSSDNDRRLLLSPSSSRRQHHQRHTSSTLAAYPCLSPPHPLPRSAAFPFTTPRKKILNPFIQSQCQHEGASSSSSSSSGLSLSASRKENSRAYVRKRSTSLFQLIDASQLPHDADCSNSRGHTRVSSVVYNADRFIPQRRDGRQQLQLQVDTTTADRAVSSPSSESSPEPQAGSGRRQLTPSQRAHNRHLASSLLSAGERTQRTLSFHQSSSPAAAAASPPDSSPLHAAHHRAMSQQLSHSSSLRSLYAAAAASAPSVSAPSSLLSSVVPPSAERILDAPQLLDDYYLNLLHWSSRGELAVALSCCVYGWEPTSSAVRLLLDLSATSPAASTLVTAVRFNADGSLIAVGCDDGVVLLVDAVTGDRLRQWRSAGGRVASLSWNGRIVSAGTRDGRILHADTRKREPLAVWAGAHEEEVCGLAWSPDGRTLASGGNDNLCHLWSAASVFSPSPQSSVSPRHSLPHHTAAVKALAWCPSQPALLATGGGTADRHLRIFDTSCSSAAASASSPPPAPRLLAAVDSRSQVCSLLWHPERSQLVSSHGYSDYQLSVWAFSLSAADAGLWKLCDLQGHSARVLHSALSPDGAVICSAGADETLRFWRVWEPKGKTATAERSGGQMRSPLAACIR